MATGALYCVAARGLAQSARDCVGPSAVPALIFGAGLGLIGSGLFVTDPVGGFPPSADPPDAGNGTAQPSNVSREGRLHNLCAIPIFAGIPVAGLTCAGSAARRGEYRWATYCAASAGGMTGAFLLFGAAFGPTSRLAGLGGVFQRLSIATGFVWVSALSLRALRRSRRAASR